MSESNLSIPISLHSKNKLMTTWGNEVVLKCFCGDTPSHSMWGQHGIPFCPVCLQKCEIILHDWGTVL